MSRCDHPGFFKRAGPFSLAEVIAACDATGLEGRDLEQQVVDVKPLDMATGNELSFLDNPKYLGQFKETRAAACFTHKKFKDRAPEQTIALLSEDPYRSFALSLHLFYPEAGHPLTLQTAGMPSRELIDPTAEIGEKVQIEPGAVIAAGAKIGEGAIIAAGAVIGYRTFIGKDSYIGPNSVVTHALVGNNVKIHAGVMIGQDGFGFAMGPCGHLKVPQIGRVIIHDNVEIGANTAIDRGALCDTTIGEGTKIDNLVQIGHNVTIGRHCVIVAQTGIAGSACLEDFVAMGGQSGVVGHVRVGQAARIAGGSHVLKDVPPGTRWVGTPAKPIRQWLKEGAVLEKLAKKQLKKQAEE